MTNQDVESFLRSSFDPLQYAAFFGVFFVFAVLESMAPRDQAPPERLWRWPTNIVLTVLNIIVMGMIPVGILTAADFAKSQQIGLLNAIDMSYWTAFALGFLGRAFLSWGTHYLNHKVPILWAIHRVHHVDTRLDVSSTVRFHPLEFVFTTPITLAGVIAIGVPPLPLLIYELMDASITVFSHSNVRLPWWVDRPLSVFIVTPDVHRVHHSSHQPETDSNFGAVLTVWDWVLGTYKRKPASELEIQENGLSEVQDSRSRNLFWLLVLPFIVLRLRVAKTKKGS